LGHHPLARRGDESALSKSNPERARLAGYPSTAVSQSRMMLGRFSLSQRVRSSLVRDALFQCGCGVGQYLLGQFRVVNCSGHGDRAYEDTEGVDRFAFSDLAVGVVASRLVTVLDGEAKRQASPRLPPFFRTAHPEPYGGFREHVSRATLARFERLHSGFPE